MGGISNLATILSVHRRPQSMAESKDQADEALQVGCLAAEESSSSTCSHDTESRKSMLPTQGILAQEKPQSLFNGKLTQVQRWVLLDPMDHTLSYWAPKKHGPGAQTQGWVVLDLKGLRNVECDEKSTRFTLYFTGCSLRFKTHSENDFARWRDAIAACFVPAV